MGQCLGSVVWSQSLADHSLTPIDKLLQRRTILTTTEGSRSKMFDSGQVNFLLLHLWFGFGKFPIKIPNFSIFCSSGKKKSHCVRSKSTQVKDGARPLIYCGSKVYLSWIRSEPISTHNPISLLLGQI